MGKQWDGGDIAFRPELWAEVLRVLKPGGYMVAFASTRGYHRMVCAIEDAGFEIRDQIMWLYGSGFPKSHDAGNGWGTALKPAHEPIVLARKPLIGTVAANVARHGTGAINVDGCRITADWENDPTKRGWQGGNSRQAAAVDFGTGGKDRVSQPHAAGRWPANIAHDGSDEVLEAFARFGEKASGAHPNGVKGRDTLGYHGGAAGVLGPVIDANTGTAARFFYCAKASRSERDAGLEGFALRTGGGMLGTADGTLLTGSGNERNNQMRNIHPTVKPVALMRWLCRLVTPPGGTVLDPFLGSGSTAIAACQEGFSCVGIEQSAEYMAIARARIAADAPLFADVA
jgi:site-specific DNA-methyltransferase (adenine-specific)